MAFYLLTVLVVLGALVLLGLVYLLVWRWL
jgi:hypothetical protein